MTSRHPSRERPPPTRFSSFYIAASGQGPLLAAGFGCPARLRRACEGGGRAVPTGCRGSAADCADAIQGIFKRKGHRPRHPRELGL